VSSHDVTIAGYLAVLVLAVGLEVAAHVERLDVQGIGTVLSRVMRNRAGRIGVIATWAWVGMHFFAR
jgi:hypothetical protein